MASKIHQSDSMLPPAPEEAIRQGFAAFFPGRGPELPTPLPEKGAVSGAGWAVRFVFTSAGDHSTLEFLAERPMQLPIHGRIHGDGSATTLESYVDSYYVDPTLGETEEAGRRRMCAHNDRITAELRAAGLL